MGASLSRTLVLLPVVGLLLSGTPGVAGALVAPADAPPPAAQTDDLDESLRQLGDSMQASGMGGLLAGRRMTVHVTAPDGSVETRGIVFEPSGDVRVEPSGFADPDLTARLAEPTLDSVVASGDPGQAVEKAIKYDLIALSGSGTTQLVTALGLAGAERNRIAVARVDLDGDDVTDAILEIEALDADDDGEFDRLVRTVVRDADDDGTFETIASSTRPAAASVGGSATLDTNDDGVRDTLLRLTGVDTDADGRMDRHRKVTLLDTRGDEQFDFYAETVGPIAPATVVSAAWTLQEAAVRMDVEGVDLDGDDRFDQKVLSVAIDVDGDGQVESASETTSAVTPSLHISAEFDTDGDGTPDAKADLTAADGNGDGAIETTESTVVNDTDGDGEYDTVVERTAYSRGFLSNSGESIEYLDDPRNLTVLGVAVSVLGIVIQLVQGG